MAFSGNEFSRLGVMGIPRVVKLFSAKVAAAPAAAVSRLDTVYIAISKANIAFISQVKTGTVYIAQENKEVVKI